ncbi:MAG: ATP-binding cassette domain-containing protein [Actinomycetia bacterium]|nr:ATP-binding cassette domain-containing protein [Actinomycetes bacterium]
MSEFAHGPKIRVEDLRVRYPAFSLEIDAFELPAGTVTVLLGPSGSGKSTLLGVIGGFEEADEGRLLLDGSLLSPQMVRRHIAAVLQTPYLMKGTVGYNVGYGLRLRRVPRAQRHARIAAVLDLVGLGGFASRSILGLSGGEAQRVALARGLVLEPDVLLLDEPLSSLDESLRADLAAEFAKILHAQGMTALYVTHSKEEAFIVADRIALLREGRIETCGAPRELLSEDQSEWTRSFLKIEPWWLKI